MIRLLHVLPCMGIGGIEQMVIDLCKHRDHGLFQCRVLAPYGGPLVGELRRAGADVFVGYGQIRSLGLWADLINLHWTGFDPFLFSLVERTLKPYVTTLHWNAALPELPAVTVCTSRRTYSIQKSKDRCLLIPNGVDLARFHPRPREPRPYLVMTRVCRTPKCAPYFWEAMKELLHRYPHIRIWIVGNSSTWVSRDGRVKFLGKRRDIPDILAETDLFVYTPYPQAGTKDLVVMEASAMGVPCVVSDVEAVTESVEDGRNGFCIPFGDAASFAHATGRLIEDEELRERMGREGIRRASEEYDVRAVARRYENAYLGVLEAYRSFRSRPNSGA